MPTDIGRPTRDYPRVSQWNDAQFLKYVKTHATECASDRNRPLFTPEQLGRLEALSGISIPFRLARPAARCAGSDMTAADYCEVDAKVALAAVTEAKKQLGITDTVKKQWTK